MVGANDGAHDVSVSLSGDNYPSTPRVANWTDAQSVDPTSSFNLMWDAMINGQADDIIMVEIRQQSQQGDSTIYESPGPGAPGQLNGASVSFTIPANTLSAGNTYEVLIRFIKTVTTDNSYASTLAGYMKETLFPLQTTGGTDSQAPTIESSRPPHGTTNVKDISSVVFRFNEAMDTSVSPAQAITWTGLTPANFNYLWSADGRELFCRYSPSLPLNATVTWTLNPDGSAAKLRDAAGNPLSNNFYGEFSTASGSNVGQTDVAMISLIKAHLFQQTNAAPIDLQRWGFELETELNGFGTVSNATLAGPFGGPANYPTDFSGDSMNLEIGFNSQSDLNTFFPNGAYTNDFGGFQDGERRIILDLPADNFPNAPTLQNFSNLAAVDPAADLPLTWTAMTTPGADDFIILEIKNAYHNTLYESPLPGETGAIDGAATGVTIPAGTLPPGRTLEAELTFVKVAERDTTSYPGVTGLAGFVTITKFMITTTGSPIVPSLENPAHNAGTFTFRLRGEYRGAYTVEWAQTLSSGFNSVISGNTDTQGTNGTGTFDISLPMGAETQRFFRAFEGYSQQSQGGQP